MLTATIQITCVFSEIPNEVVIDAAPTSLNEHLLDNDNYLQLKDLCCNAAKPKEKSIWFVLFY